MRLLRALLGPAASQRSYSKVIRNSITTEQRDRMAAYIAAGFRKRLGVLFDSPWIPDAKVDEAKALGEVCQAVRRKVS